MRGAKRTPTHSRIFARRISATQTLSGLNLEEANLKWADLRGARLLNAKLGRANLQGAHLEQADFTGAKDLFEEQFAGGYLFGARLPAAMSIFRGLASIEETFKSLQQVFFRHSAPPSAMWGIFGVGLEVRYNLLPIRGDDYA
jgi:hypothetical protein